MTEKAKPRLYLVIRPDFDQQEFLRFLNEESLVWSRTDSATGPEEIVEAAGRLCYLSFGSRQSPRTNEEYLRNLVKQGHESVLEHSVWGFVLTGVSRAFTHQFVRHRVGFAFSQLSQQYHDQRDAPAVEPGILEASPDLSEIWTHSIVESQRAYKAIIDRLESEVRSQGLAPDQARELRRRNRSAARSVLPEATETKLFFTANARAIRDFLTLRGSIIGDEEMRLVSAALLETVRREAPSLFQDFEIEVLDGLPIVRRVQLEG